MRSTVVSPAPSEIRQIGRQVVVDAEAPRVFDDQRHADVLREPHRHGVARLLDAVAQRRGAGVFADGIVFRPPRRHAGALVDLDRPVHHQRRGRVAVVERGRIDERLERGAGLPHRLRRAVELALVVGEAADHRQHAAGRRVHHHHRAGDFRHLAQPPGVGFLVERLDIDDVADFEHLADLGRHLALDRPFGGLGPFHAIERDDAGLALLGQRAARSRAG